MYLEHFRLSQEPFSIAPDPNFLYLSASHREALAHLLYGFSHGGFVLITGEVGTGKTTLLRNLVRQTPEDLDVAFILNPRLTVRELLETLCDELGVPVRHEGQDPSTVKGFIDPLNRHLLATHQSGRSTVVIIDEAQNLSPAVLEQIRLLTNLETNERKLLRIILLGQPELTELLARPELRQLGQRITARYHLSQLSREDTFAYVVHRLSRAGGSPHLFTRRALGRLHAISGGVPRLINSIADRALLGAYVEGRDRVSARIVNRAAAEVLGRPVGLPRWAVAGVAGVILAGAAWAVWQGPRLLPGDSSAPAVATGLGERPSAPVAVGDERSPEAAADSTPPQPPSSPAGSAPPAGNRPQAARPAPAAAPASPTPGSTPGAEREAPTAAEVPATAATGSAAGRGGRVERASAAAPSTRPVSRPPGTTQQSRRNAYRAAFAAWDADLEAAPAGQIPCDFAPSVGLQCLGTRGDWAEVDRLDLPVILELWDGAATPFYATLLKRDGARYQLVLDGERQWIEPRDLRDLWFGAYVVLWRTPPGYSGSLRQGDYHDTVAWLRQQLGTLGYAVGGADPRRFGPGLETAVVAFQRDQGLSTDGIVGPATWIRLAAALDLPHPGLAG